MKENETLQRENNSAVLLLKSDKKLSPQQEVPSISIKNSDSQNNLQDSNQYLMVKTSGNAKLI